MAWRGAEVHANRTLARLRALFNWAVEKDRLSTSPCIGAKPPNREYARVRPVKSFDAILSAVVMELQRTQGAKVKLTLEILSLIHI